jgi:hypothetical protein
VTAADASAQAKKKKAIAAKEKKKLEEMEETSLGEEDNEALAAVAKAKKQSEMLANCKLEAAAAAAAANMTMSCAMNKSMSPSPESSENGIRGRLEFRRLAIMAITDGKDSKSTVESNGLESNKSQMILSRQQVLKMCRQGIRGGTKQGDEEQVEAVSSRQQKRRRERTIAASTMTSESLTLFEDVNVQVELMYTSSSSGHDDVSDGGGSGVDGIEGNDDNSFRSLSSLGTIGSGGDISRKKRRKKMSFVVAKSDVDKGCSRECSDHSGHLHCYRSTRNSKNGAKKLEVQTAEVGTKPDQRRRKRRRKKMRMKQLESLQEVEPAADTRLGRGSRTFNQSMRFISSFVSRRRSNSLSFTNGNSSSTCTLRMNVVSSCPPVSKPPDVVLAKEKKAATQLGVIVGAFILCWLPYFTLFMVVAYCGEEKCVNDAVFTTSIWFGYFNSALNPILYPLCNANFKRAFKRMLGMAPKPPPLLPPPAPSNRLRMQRLQATLSTHTFSRCDREGSERQKQIRTFASS